MLFFGKLNKELRICKFLLVFALLMITLLGCSTEETSKIRIRVSLFPLAGDFDTYLFNLNENGVLGVSFGDRRSNNIKSSRYMSEKGLVRKERKLTDSELARIEELAKDINQKEEISVSRKVLVVGGRQIVILINNKVYSFYEFEHVNDSFGILADEIFKLSPIEVIPDKYF